MRPTTPSSGALWMRHKGGECMLWMFWAPLIGAFLVLCIVAYVGLKGARKVRKDIFRLAGVKEEEEQEAV